MVCLAQRSKEHKRTVCKHGRMSLKYLTLTHTLTPPLCKAGLVCESLLSSSSQTFRPLSPASPPTAYSNPYTPFLLPLFWNTLTLSNG